ncbi:MAG: PIN domain-containing protein [Candidatus Thermoplasmatota archaeon]|jgi:predicted nucleic acid-binding protein|nr:PIN domain-containing protein [Candidatus Thermoplasmatota archaeon]MCL5786157.1 PIN domain-containing protein [Candidatus Thermoplasmatota archaeon]
MTMLVDTNVLVYDAIENSPHHDRASKLIDESEDPLINSLSIVELGLVLPRYGIDNDSVRMKLEELFYSDYFTVSWLSESMLEGASAFMAENGLSFRDFNDWIIAFDAHSRNVPLVTFDKTLSKKCKKLGVQVIEI